MTSAQVWAWGSGRARGLVTQRPQGEGVQSGKAAPRRRRQPCRRPQAGSQDLQGALWVA